VEINFAGFSGMERRRRGGGDKRSKEMEHCIKSAFEGVLLLHLYPHSTITLNIHIISQDGSLLAACINASTLALIDAGIPMADYLVACTAASSASSSAADNASADDPLLDLNTLEEQELPFLTVGTLGDSDKVAVCVMETRVRMERLEGMLAVGIEGCKKMRGILDEVVKGYGLIANEVFKSWTTSCPFAMFGVLCLRIKQRAQRNRNITGACMSRGACTHQDSHSVAMSENTS
jgi:exosome complex component RRP41